MNAESEVLEAIELKVPSVSPTLQSDLSADGDTSTMQISISSDITPSPQDTLNNEPKAKKRRKQSNPLKIQNPTSPKFDLPAYELGEQGTSEASETASYPFENVLQGQNHVIEKSRTPDSGSQKGSLSRVTDALFNSKLREAAKASTNSSKSKDSSLQSLTDLSSPESSEEMSSNNDFKNSMQILAYPQLPPMLPINPVDIARDTMKLSSGYPFAEFSSSMQHGNMNLSVSQRSFVTSSGVRVFNPEAYCELCEKEFCNKYFLKTHKANKHGICSIDNNNTSGYSYKTSYKNMQMNPQAAQQMITQMCENGATFGSADSYCNICQKYFCNKYFLKKHRQNIHGIMEEQQVVIPSSIHVPVISSPLPVMRTISLDSKAMESSSGKSTKDEESKMNVSMENIKNSLSSNIPLVNGSSLQLNQSKSQAQSISQKEKKSEKFLCELCNIEFCDKCYLDAHKLNKHGQSKTAGTEFPDFSEIGKVENNEKTSPSEDPDEAKDFKGQMCAPCMKNFTSAEAFQYHMLETHGASLKDEDDGIKTSDLMHKKNGHSSFESEGLIDMSNKSPSSHEMDSSNSSTDSGSHNCGICMAKCRDKKCLILHLESEHNLPGSALEMCLMQENITCEVCQEQFLDRIALLSHKFKTHGIVPPGLEAYSDGIENGEYSFYSGGSSRKSGGSSFCKFCNKELCNKYFLKTHMMKLHGIDVDKVQQEKLPTASSGGVYCDICQKFLCSKYFLKAHKQNVHGIVDDSAKLSVVGSPSYGNISVNEQKMDWNSSPGYPNPAKLSTNGLSESTTEEALKRNNNTLFTCDICGQEFTDKIMLQFHLVNKHVKSNEGKAYPNTLCSGEDSKDAFKASLLPCSCCSFVNLDDSAKLAQINNPEANLVISCATCNATYRLSDYHTHHLSHGVSLSADKKPPIENGVHELTFGLPGNESSRDKPRKFKRFRCSKCDMTFRTKLRCLHHIQVKHKSKKGLTVQCDPPTPSKKNSLNNNGVARKNLEQKNATENGTGLLGGKESEDNISLMNSSCFQDPTHLPYKLPKDSDVIMQPFHLTEPKPDGVSKQNIFVPSLVYLPVSQKVSETLTVAFTLTPA